jgi:hypothetical protein
VTGRCEKIVFKIWSELGAKKIALGCRISDRWAVGKHLGSKIKSRKFRQINFFTSSRPRISWPRISATNLGHESLATNLWVAGGASPAAIAITSPLGSPSWNGLQIVTVRGLCGDSMGMPSRNDAKIGTVGSGQVNPRHMAIVSDFFKSQNQTYSDMPACATGFNGLTAVSKAYLRAPVGMSGRSWPRRQVCDGFSCSSGFSDRS